MILVGIMLLIQMACSTQPIKPITNTSADSEILVTKMPSNNATLIRVKAGKELKLVRMMEGGACNINRQGVIALFGLYANPDDIDRIKLLQGSGIFSSFESQIEAFSIRALQQTVDGLSFQSSIKTKNNTQQQLSDRFSALFVDSIAKDITDFEAKTTLTIDVISQPDSITIYQNNCNTPHDH